MRFDPRKTGWLYAMLVPALIFGPGSASLGAALASVALTLVTVTLGHTVGLHRGIIHRSYRTSAVFRRLSAVLFVLTGLGGPLSWLKVHYLRDHFQSQPEPPATLRYDHGLATDLWWTLHCAPLCDDWDALGIPPEDLADPWLRAVDRGWLGIQLLQAAILFAVGGWDLLVIGWFARNAVVLIGHWFVGYVAHTCGTRRYRIANVAEEGRNTWLLGVLSCGEGFHNNHHAAPSSARIGRHWTELDLGWLTIVGLERLGVVWDVNRPRSIEDLLRPGARLDRGRSWTTPPTSSSSGPPWSGSTPMPAPAGPIGPA